MLVTDPSPSHMFTALLHSVDNNLPGLHLFFRGLHALGLPLNEITLRLVSGFCAWAGLLGTYACLRFAFDRWSALGGVVTLLVGSLLIANVFESRYYAPWFAICAWFCYCLAALRVKGRTVRMHWLLGLLTLQLMLTIHYFGVITFGLAVGADFLADKRSVRERLRVRWPLLFAVPAFALISFFYFHQRQVLTVDFVDRTAELFDCGLFSQA